MLLLEERRFMHICWSGDRFVKAPRSVHFGAEIDNSCFLAISVLEPVKLKMISVLYLQAELDKLRGTREYIEVLE